MASVIDTDPYMNFRFGLRLTRESKWIGFSAIEISPKTPGNGGGTLELEKAWDEELLGLLNLGKINVNVGIWHVTEEFGGKDPGFQIDLHGVNFQQAFIGTINLDAMPASKRLSLSEIAPEDVQKTRVLLGKITAHYDRSDFHIKETSFVGKAAPQSSTGLSGPVYM